MSGAVPSLFVWYSQLAFILLFFLGAQLQAVEDATVVNLVHFLVLLCLKKEIFLPGANPPEVAFFATPSA